MSRSDRSLVAVLAHGRALAEAMRALWAGGDAVLPLPAGAPAAELSDILARMRPEWLLEGGRTIRLRDGVGVDAETAAVVLTSGSTGPTKGVELAAGQLSAAAEAVVAKVAPDRAGRWLCPLPLHRIGGLSILFRSEVMGTEPIIHDRFDPAAVARETGASFVSLVPTMLNRLLASGADLTGFDAVLVGGGPVPGDLVRRAGDAGLRVAVTYGMTETCGGVVHDGVPLEGVEVSVDEGGVVSLRGPMVMTGYRCDPELSARVLTDGWFRTADRGALDRGRLIVWGRADDVIVTGGEKVSPGEVRAVLVQHDAVVEANVVGEPDDEWGERVVAHVTTSGDIEAEELKRFVAARVAAHKVPKRIVVRRG